MLAAVTGAVAASYAGVGGTVIGVAVMSVASTAGAAIYKHYLGRSQERLRSAAVVIAPLATFNGVTGHRSRRPGEATSAGQAASAGESARAGESGRARGDRAQAAEDHALAPGNAAGNTSESAGSAGERADAAGATVQQGRAAGELSSWPWSPDAPVTEAFPAVGGEATRWSGPPAEAAGLADSPTFPGPQRAGQAAAAQDTADSQGTGADGLGAHGLGADPVGTDQVGTDHLSAGHASAGHGDPGNGSPGNGADREPSGQAAARGARRRWPVYAGAAAGVFALTLGSLTAVEVAAGKPLDALIWGRHNVGTTIGDATGTQHSRPAPGTTPHGTSPSPSHSRTGSPTPTPTPSSSSPTPTPTPTRSPSVSPSPSVSAPAPISPSPSASANPSKAATP